MRSILSFLIVLIHFAVNAKPIMQYQYCKKTNQHISDTLLIEDMNCFSNILKETDSIHVSMSNLAKSLDIGYITEDKESITKPLMKLSWTNYKLGNYNTSLNYGIKALNRSSETKQFKEKLLEYKNLYKSRLETGDLKGTLSYLKRYDHYKDSILDLQKDISINEILVKYEATKKLQECELLQKENEIQGLRLSKNKQIIISIIGVITLIIILFALIFLQISYKNKIKALELEQKLYRVQINPKFISRSLSIVKKKIINSNALIASTFIADFAKLMRQILENSKEQLISLEKEIQTINYYLNIHKDYGEKKVLCHFLLDEDLDTTEWSIPPMLLHPFLSYAIENELKGERNEVVVSAEHNGGVVSFSVELISENLLFFDNSDVAIISLIKERLNRINKIYNKSIEFDYNKINLNNRSAFSNKVTVKLPEY